MVFLIGPGEVNSPSHIMRTGPALFPNFRGVEGSHSGRVHLS